MDPQDCIPTLNRAIQEFGGEGDSKVFPSLPLPPTPPPPPPPPRTTLSLPSGRRATEPPPVGSASQTAEPSSEAKVIVSKTCLESKRFQKYVLKILSSLISQLPDNTFWTALKRFFGFTRKLTKAASKKLMRYTEEKKNLKIKVKDMKEIIQTINISPPTQKDACIIYEVLKYLESNKRKIQIQNLIRFLDAFCEVIFRSSSYDSNKILPNTAFTSVKSLEDVLSRQPNDLSVEKLNKLNEILQLYNKPEINPNVSLAPDKFDALAEGMRTLAGHTRRNKRKRTSKRSLGKRLPSQRKKTSRIEIIKSI